MGKHLDKVALARAYERRGPRGQVEHVSGYLGELQAALGKPALGKLSPASWSAFLLRNGDGSALHEMHHAAPHDRVVVHDRLERAAEAVRAGDRATAVEHLEAASSHAHYSGMAAEGGRSRVSTALDHHIFKLSGGASPVEIRQQEDLARGRSPIVWASGSPGLGGYGGGHP